MPETTLGGLAIEVRSKNAGPFWITVELFMRDADGYQIYRIPSLNVVKISYPRPVSQGSLRDRDTHAGQHHVPLAQLVVPVS